EVLQHAELTVSLYGSEDALAKLRTLLPDSRFEMMIAKYFLSCSKFIAVRWFSSSAKACSSSENIKFMPFAQA
ncbi:hypothetical protein OBE_02983, partial [human gut metagenome]